MAGPKKESDVSNKKMSLGKNLLLVSILVVLLIIVGVAIAYNVHQRTVANMPTVLTITRTGPYSQATSKTESLTVDVKSSQKANSLLGDIKTLQQVPRGSTSCPADDGSRYSLDFADQNLIVAALPTGCRTVTVSNSSVAYRANSQFWKDLHTATGKPIDPNIQDSQYY